MTTVAIDTVVDNGGFQAAATRSWSHTVNSGTSRLLEVHLAYWNTGGTATVTYGGTALTQSVQSALSGGSDRAEIWTMIAPTVGTATVLVTFSANADGECASISFFNVHQTTPVRNSGSTTGSGTAVSISATGALTGDCVTDCVADSDRTRTLTMGAQTNRVQRFNDTTGTGEAGAGSTVTTAPTPQTLNWTIGFTETWSIAYLVLANDGGAVSVAAPLLMLLGVGS